MRYNKGMFLRTLSTILLSCCFLLTPAARAGEPAGVIEAKIYNDPEALVTLPRAGANPDGHGPVYAPGVIPTRQDAHEVIQSARAALLYTPSHLRVKMQNMLSELDILLIKQNVTSLAGVRCTEAVFVNGDLTLRFEYDDRTWIMGLYRRFVDAAEEDWCYTGPLYSDYVSQEKQKNAGKKKRGRNAKNRSSVRRNSSKKIKEEAPPVFDDLKELCCYVISAMPYCPETLELHCTQPLTEQQMDVLTLASRAYSKSIGGCGGGQIELISQTAHKDGSCTIRPTLSYGEHDLLYAAYRGLIETDRLSEEQQIGLKIATELVESIREAYTTPYQRALAAHDSVVLYCRYKIHPSPDLISDMLMHKRGQCAHYAATYCLLLNMLDIDCIQVIGDDHRRKVGHAWNLVYLDGVWSQADVTWDDIRERRSAYLIHDHFLFTDIERYLGVGVVENIQASGNEPTENYPGVAKMGTKWEKLDYPQCTDNSNNYKARFAKEYKTMDDMVADMLGRLSGGGPVLLEGTVKELEDNFELDPEEELDAELVEKLMEKPCLARELVQKALMKRGSVAQPVVDCSVCGKVTLYCK